MPAPLKSSAAALHVTYLAMYRRYARSKQCAQPTQYICLLRPSSVKFALVLPTYSIWLVTIAIHIKWYRVIGSYTV